MRVYKEVNSAYNFEFWSGAKDTVAILFDSEVQTIFDVLEDIYPDGIDETTLNDIFWFEDDFIAETLGWSDFETLYKARSGDLWFNTQEKYEEYLEEQEAEEE